VRSSPPMIRRALMWQSPSSTRRWRITIGPADPPVGGRIKLLNLWVEVVGGLKE
jgi:hypothetical protein